MSNNSHVRKKYRRSSPLAGVVAVLLVLVIALTAAVVVLAVQNKKLRSLVDVGDNSSLPSFSVTQSGSAQSSSVVSQTGSKPAQVSNVDPNSWSLRIANWENVLPSDFTVETATVTPAYCSRAMSFDARAADALNKMLAAAHADGVNLIVISSYRTMTYQTNLYNKEVNKWIGQGYNEADAKVKAATVVAVPGMSDHNLGLAVDLNSVEKSFENSTQFTWLQSHAEEYGFVMRYPKDKEKITRIIYEPWHYRYVGVEAAKEMNDLDMCLEEYVPYLRGEKFVVSSDYVSAN